MLSPDSLDKLAQALTEQNGNVKKVLFAFLAEQFPEFEALLDVSANALGIQDAATFDLIMRAKPNSDSGCAGDVALGVAVCDTLHEAELKAAYDKLAKLKSESNTLQLHTLVVAKSSPNTLEAIGATLIEQNKKFSSGKWLDSVVVLDKGIVSYGAHDPTSETVGSFLFHAAVAGDTALPALYIKLMACATRNPLRPMMYRVSATLLVARPSERHKEVEPLTDTELSGLTLIDYQYDLRGQLRPIAESQYRDRKVPTFPIEIVVSGDSVAGQIEYLEWQDGGVLVLRGEFPLDIFLLMSGAKASRHMGVVRKMGIQISSVLPLSKGGFNALLKSIQSRSNFSFRSSRPPLVIQKVSDEGTSVPLVARVRMGLLTLRNHVPSASVNIQGYDRALELIFRNLKSARDNLSSIKEIYERHTTGLADGTVGHIEGNVIHIAEPLDAPLREALENFINACSRILRVGMKNLISALGEDLDFFYKQDNAFRVGLEKLAQEDAGLASYLERSRSEWSDALTKLRNNALEHGDGLLNEATYKIVASKIAITEPAVSGRPVRNFSEFIFDRLSKFVEELTVYLLQKKLGCGFKFGEIPLNMRDPRCALRFQLALSVNGDKWEIKYTSTTFEQT